MAVFRGQKTDGKAHIEADRASRSEATLRARDGLRRNRVPATNADQGCFLPRDAPPAWDVSLREDAPDCFRVRVSDDDDQEYERTWPERADAEAVYNEIVAFAPLSISDVLDLLWPERRKKRSDDITTRTKGH